MDPIPRGATAGRPRAVGAVDPTAPCAATSLALGEPLAGTGAQAAGWLAVEHDGPWSPRAPTPAELGDALPRLEGVADVRLQLVRRVRVGSDADGGAGRHARGDAPRTVLLGSAARNPGARWLRRLEVADDRELAALDPALALASEPPDLGEPVDHDTWLVCTHARRDACCARWGRPVADALARAGHDVWETTHVAGHRFAGTAVVLPAGATFGRLDAATAPALADGVAAGRLDPAHLRGLGALPAPAQAADAALRARLDGPGLDAVRVTAVTRDGEHSRVTLEVAGATWHAEVRTQPTVVPRHVSDGAAPTTPDVQVVTSLVPA